MTTFSRERRATASALKTFCFSSLFLVLSACATLQDEGPRVLFETSGGLETVVILGTNDIHGALAPEKMKTKDDAATPYEKGGAAILASHVNILRNEFGPRFLILDAGDQFQGSIDSNLEEGKPMVEFFNHIGVNAAVLGNHEFDFGPKGDDAQAKVNEGGKPDLRGALKERITEARYPYLAANVVDKKTGKPAVPGTKPSVILTAGGLKIGVIGLTTLDTPVTTRPDFVKDVQFKDMAKTALDEAKKLRDEGAHIIVALTHAGLVCDVAEKSGKTIRTSPVKAETDVQSHCDPKHEVPQLIRALPKGTIDAVVSGHTHQVIHHWIDGVPVIQSGTRNVYYNLLYLTYDWKTKKLATDRTRIEGPIPVCPQVFENQRNCNGEQPAPKNGRGDLVTPVLHGKSISPDPSTERLLAPVFERTEQAKKRIVGKAARKIEHLRTAESPMGILVADAVRKSIGAQVAIVNSGGIRANLEEGDITYESVFRALPFDNNVSKLDLTGRELKTFIRIAESGARGYFPVSGLKLRLIDLKYEPWSKDLDGNGKIEPWEQDRLIEARLEDGTLIEDSKRYSVATIDFLVQGGDSFGWFMNSIPKERVVLAAGPILRDAIVSYIGSFKDDLNSEKNPLFNPADPRLKLENRPAKKERQSPAKRRKRR